jgi:5-methylcytosine-specific restriction endonuclease McrA
VTGPSNSHDIPDPIKRAVWERDGGRCTYVDERGHRCCETGGLEYDHIEGYARTRVHDPDLIRLLCRAHNEHAAEQLYGRAFMDRMRNRTRAGASSQASPF